MCDFTISPHSNTGSHKEVLNVPQLSSTTSLSELVINPQHWRLSFKYNLNILLQVFFSQYSKKHKVSWQFLASYTGLQLLQGAASYI